MHTAAKDSDTPSDSILHCTALPSRHPHIQKPLGTLKQTQPVVTHSSTAPPQHTRLGAPILQTHRQTDWTDTPYPHTVLVGNPTSHGDTLAILHTGTYNQPQTNSSQDPPAPVPAAPSSAVFFVGEEKGRTQLGVDGSLREERFWFGMTLISSSTWLGDVLRPGSRGPSAGLWNN